MPNELTCQRQIASALLEKNERTIHRWCKDGILTVVGLNKQGTPMFDIDAVLALCGDLKDADEEMAELILEADQGSAEAQNDLGIVLLQAGRQAGALALFTMAANQDHPDAMHFLFQCHQRGMGTDVNNALAMMWLSKAAAHGHKIAQAQLDGILNAAEQVLQNQT
jgi:TPR repeat protein